MGEISHACNGERREKSSPLGELLQREVNFNLQAQQDRLGTAR